MAFRTYQIIKSVRDLPPRDIRVYSPLDPLEVFFLRDEGVIAIDIAINNRSSTTALTVNYNDEDAITIPLNEADARSDVYVERIRIADHTTFTCTAHVVSLDLLKKLNAVEVR